MPGQAPPISDERDGLVAFLRQQRDGIRYAAFGLTDDQARLTPTAGALSIGGLVKHITAMERSWVDTMLQRSRQSSDQLEELEASYGDDFVMRPEETLAGLLADLDRSAAETEAAVAGIADMGQDVPVPKGVPWFPDDVENWSVRWVLLHLIEEVARHAGHADIVRESIDGATMYELMAGAEGWPATEWLRPWQPPADT
jgi:uncharacterized damage-inducible protein DinB